MNLQPRFCHLRLFCSLIGLVWLLGQAANAASPDEHTSGLKVTFRSPDITFVDVTTRPNVCLFVKAANPPTPFLPPGPFTAQWDGFVSLDLRSEYTFHTLFNGELELELNGTMVLSTNSTGTAVVRSKAIRLNKGTNCFKALFRSSPAGDAWLRVEWAARDGLPMPIPDASLSYATDAELKRGQQLRLGRELVAQYRCLKCHSGPASAAHVPDLSMDAPSFEGIGSRRHYEWMMKWILDPQAQRPDAKMPRVFRRANAPKDAAAAAAFLATLKGAATEPKIVSGDHAAVGKELFEKLHCVGCHVAPDASETDPSRISLQQVPEKFAPGALASFLKRPEADYAWIKMPNFKLSDDEAVQLSAYLEANSQASSSGAAPDDKEFIERGRKLVQSSGCLNCHASNLRNEFSAKSFVTLPSGRWSTGCLAAADAAGSKAPDVSLSEQERHALQTFAATDRKSLEQFDAAEFAQREITNLNCAACHGKLEGFPKIEILGGKLKPEWSGRFIAGEVPYKPRPWLESRMPAFKSYAKPLAIGLAMLHGYPAKTPVEPAIESEAVETGRKLISAAGGFSCIACHGISEMAATQVFESAGINLAYSGERLLRPYYQRWVLNPLSIDPGTKMPVYFDEKGRSPLTEFFDGDGVRQVGAMWEYMRLGEKMPPPPVQ